MTRSCGNNRNGRFKPLVAVALLTAAAVTNAVEYGVDVSFPIHQEAVSDNYEWLPHNHDPTLRVPKRYQGMPIQPLGNRQAFYEDFVEGCAKYFGKKGSRCYLTESERVEMSRRQPQSMQNYTDIGYKKIKAPEKLFQMLKEFWEKNKDTEKIENWPAGNTYTNNWNAPTYLVSVEDSTLRGGGYNLKKQLWDAARNVISEWTGQELTECSLYGIRVYKTNAVLATHVDRLPLVSSAIINVAQDVDEPWPLEVYGHDGKATNVTMEPGDMVLYESHSVLHGRPFPLKGRFMANVFIHFEPTGHSLRHNARIELENNAKDVHTKYKEAIKNGQGGHENEMDGSGLPPYIIPGTPEESHWRREHPQGKRGKTEEFTTGSTPVHIAAQQGDLDTVRKLVDADKSLVHKRDINGWTAIHEAARGGHVHVVKYLVEAGANINVKTHGEGATPLWWARQVHGDDHPIIEFLESIGALETGPEF